MELPLKALKLGVGRRTTRYLIETKQLSYVLPSNQGSFSWKHEHSNTILKDVTCEARPAEVTAIIGPSGAGKSTLLGVLAGMADPTRMVGEVLVNGQEMDISRYRRVSGYVTQEDSLFPLLSVYETLMYSARLRLRAGSAESAARVGELLKELGLDHVANSRVGGVHGGRGISGGEKRRVSIGVELVHDPAILLLDEPTSGLDSASALQIVTLLQSMSTVQGKTIVLTIHQPGFRIVELFNRVVLISDGTVRHNASVGLLAKRLRDAGHWIPPHVNVLEYAMDAFTAPVPEASPQNHTPGFVGSPAKEDRVVYANSRCREVAILGERFFKNILRTKQLFLARMIQSMVAGVGLGTIFMNVNDMQSRLGFFAFTLAFLLSSTTEGLPIFLQERGILMRETTRGAYRVSSYVIANTLIFLPFLLAVGLLYAIPVYWLVGFRREVDVFLYFSLVIWIVVVMANSFVSFFSALVPNFIMGNSLIAGLMGSYFLFSGYFISKDSIPKYWIFMHYLSMFKYPFEALLVNEYGGRSGRRECMERREGVCILDGGMFLRQQGLDEPKKWINLGVMVVFICGYRMFCFLVLWFRCYKVRR